MELLLGSAVLISLLALTVGSYARTRDALHPAPLNAGLWLVVMASYLLLPHNLQPLAGPALIFVLLAVAAFTFGGVAASHRATASGRPRRYEATWWRHALLLASLGGLPLFLLKAEALANSAPYTESSFINLRIALTGALDEMQTFGILGYLVPVSFTSTLVELAASRRRLFEWQGWLGFAASIAYALLSTGRTFIFLLVTALAMVAFLQKRARPAQIGMATLALFAAGFFGLGMLANKIGVDTPNIDSLAALDAVALYLLGGVAALDVSLLRDAPLDWGLNAFRTPLAVLQALGADVQVLPLVKEYVYVPLPTNVYTAVQPYAADFGAAGVLGFFGLFGGFQAGLHLRAREPGADPRVVIAAGLAAYPLLMQFFQDQYLSLLSTWITFALLVWPAFRPVRE